MEGLLFPVFLSCVRVFASSTLVNNSEYYVTSIMNVVIILLVDKIILVMYNYYKATYTS